MANFEISRRMETGAEVTTKAISSFLQERLAKSCKYEILSDTENLLVIEGRVNESVLTPVVKFRSSFELKNNGPTKKLYVDIKTSVTWWFWVLFVLGFLSYGALLIVDFVLLFIQNKKPAETIKRAIKAVETEFSTSQPEYDW